MHKAAIQSVHPAKVDRKSKRKPIGFDRRTRRRHDGNDKAIQSQSESVSHIIGRLQCQSKFNTIWPLHVIHIGGGERLFYDS